MLVYAAGIKAKLPLFPCENVIRQSICTILGISGSNSLFLRVNSLFSLKNLLRKDRGPSLACEELPQAAVQLAEHLSPKLSDLPQRMVRRCVIADAAAGRVRAKLDFLRIRFVT